MAVGTPVSKWVELGKSQGKPRNGQQANGMPKNAPVEALRPSFPFFGHQRPQGSHHHQLKLRQDDRALGTSRFLSKLLGNQLEESHPILDWSGWSSRQLQIGRYSCVQVGERIAFRRVKNSVIDQALGNESWYPYLHFRPHANLRRGLSP